LAPLRARFGDSLKLTSKRAAINHRSLKGPSSRHQRRSAAVVPGCLSRRLPRMKFRIAKFAIGQVVKHRKYPFRGIVYDVDPVFANTEEWWQSIPAEVRPRKDQPFYHLFAENTDTEYVAYVSEQNLMPDTSGDPIRHPQVNEMFVRALDGAYRIKTARYN
jgi:heat shock protein HspQ